MSYEIICYTRNGQPPRIPALVGAVGLLGWQAQFLDRERGVAVEITNAFMALGWRSGSRIPADLQAAIGRGEDVETLPEEVAGCGILAKRLNRSEAYEAAAEVPFFRPSSRLYIQSAVLELGIYFSVGRSGPGTRNFTTAIAIAYAALAGGIVEDPQFSRYMRVRGAPLPIAARTRFASRRWEFWDTPAVLMGLIFGRR